MEVYLPLSQEEIDADLQQLYEASASAAQHKHRRAAAGLRPAAAAQPGGGASSDELSPSSAQGEDENESGNPAEQQWASGPKAAGGLPGAAAQQPMVMA